MGNKLSECGVFSQEDRLYQVTCFWREGEVLIRPCYFFLQFLPELMNVLRGKELEVSIGGAVFLVERRKGCQHADQ